MSDVRPQTSDIRKTKSPGSLPGSHCSTPPTLRPLGLRRGRRRLRRRRLRGRRGHLPGVGHHVLAGVGHHHLRCVRRRGLRSRRFTGLLAGSDHRHQGDCECETLHGSPSIRNGLWGRRTGRKASTPPREVKSSAAGYLSRPVTSRRDFLGFLGALPALRRPRHGAPPAIEVRPSALFAQPDGRKNLVRIAVSGLDAPAARAQVIGRHGELIGTAGLLRLGEGLTLQGEVWVPLSEPTSYRIDLEVGRQQVARQTVRLVPPRRWTPYWLSSNHTDIGYTDLQERCLEIHRKNLDAALARLATHPDYHWSAECALQVLSYVENRSPAAGDALVQAIRDGKVGFGAVFANLLTGILDHETFARVIWPAGLFARERGLGYLSAQITDVPGQTLTFPTVLAASGVRYLASGPNPERAVPLLPEAEATRYKLLGEWTPYPQLYWWEGPDGSRVLHWRAYHYGDALRFGFDVSAETMARRLSDWLLTNPVLVSPGYPYDVALLYGAQWA